MKLAPGYLFPVAVVVVIIAVVLVFFIRLRIKTEPPKTALPGIEDFPVEYWKKLAEKKFFFGHHSVGYNIIEGIKDIVGKYDYIKVNIVETDNPADFDKPVFAHARVGRNMDTDSKIQGFRKVMDAGIADKADIAFFKFCYVDVNHDSNLDKIFEEYSGAMEGLVEKYPGTAFLHVTVPVCSPSANAKKMAKFFVKSLIGKAGVLEDNAKRQQYNTLVRAAYAQKQHVFDLALAETVNPDGLRCYMKSDQKKIYVMPGVYTNDGGHLSPQGRRKVAQQLLITLANIANQQ